MTTWTFAELIEMADWLRDLPRDELQMVRDVMSQVAALDGYLRPTGRQIAALYTVAIDNLARDDEDPLPELLRIEEAVETARQRKAARG